MKKLLCIAGILALAGAQSSFAAGRSSFSFGSHSSGHSSPYSYNSHNSHSYSNSHNSYNSHSYSSNSHNYSNSHYPSSHSSYNSHSNSHSPSYGFSISVGHGRSYSSSSHHPRVCTKRHGHYQYRTERYITGYTTRQEKYYVPGSTYKVWDHHSNCYTTRTNVGYYSYRTIRVPRYGTRSVKTWVSSACNCF